MCSELIQRTDETGKENGMEQVKQRVIRYWSLRAEGFETQRIREFKSEKRALWEAELNRYLPDGKPLKILDIGTGTGFFACLLASQGHQVTGIDLTPEMIAGAEHMADLLGLHAEFRVNDAEDPDFEAESFDALVTRNLTWILPHASKAFRKWHRILKPGGVLINFDADYCTAAENEAETELPENHAHKLVPDYLKAENDAITMELAAYQEPRPQWDVQLLAEAGFEKIIVDLGVYRRLYASVDEFYNPAKVFAIAAYK